MEIEDYCIIKQDSLSGLEKEVRYLIDKGWVPQGGITIDSSAYSSRYFQAMIKPKPPKKEQLVII